MRESETKNALAGRSIIGSTRGLRIPRTHMAEQAWRSTLVHVRRELGRVDGYNGWRIRMFHQSSVDCATREVFERAE